MPKAIFIPLGPQVQKVMDALVVQKVLPKERIIRGMLHPSGQNSYRINYLTGASRGAIPHATNPLPYDNGASTFVKSTSKHRSPRCQILLACRTMR